MERHGPDHRCFVNGSESIKVSVVSIETRPGDLRLPLAVIAIASAAIFFFLVWLLFFKQASEIADSSLDFLPALNASLNAGATVCLVSGYVAIRRRRIRVHIACMISALILSACFLVSYLIYHNLHGDTHYPGEGFMLTAYFSVLISHIACTAIALPMVITTFFLAFTRRFDIHKRVAKYALPLWLYVSVTGVAIYFLLRAALEQ